MKRIRKPDEMEMSINLKAVRIAWVYSGLFLLVWVSYDWLTKGVLNGMAFILMTSQVSLYWAVNIFLKWKLGKDEK
jgi:hypothetical protein